MITATTERRARPIRTPRTDSRLRQNRAHVINQELFRGALIRERRRADRSGQSLALVLVGVDDCSAGEPASTWRGVVDALSAVKREADVLGWFERHAAIGVILAEIPSSDAGFVSDLESRVHRELARRLDVGVLDGLSVRILTHLESAAARQDVESVDPLLTNLRPATRRDKVNAAAKRALDIIGSTMLLVLLAPIFLIVAALVKLTSPGPVFFRQVRVGAKAKPFTMLKFRSMRTDASAAIHQAYVTSFINGGAQPALSAAADGTPVFKLTKDPRITPVGSFLRKTSLDELPQLWNVLCGTMSLVGPRPPLQYEVDQYKPWHCRRVLEAKPGITGLWQVEGRSRTTFDEMVRLDLRYVRNCSLWNDVKILLATPGAVIAGKGAC